MNASETYIQQLIGLQTRLYAYILTLLADRTAADDVLQETNLVLYRKAREFAEGADFEPWAFSIARTQCLAFWKLRGRDRLVLGDDAIDRIACRAEAGLDEIDSQRAARRCATPITRLWWVRSLRRRSCWSGTRTARPHLISCAPCPTGSLARASRSSPGI